MTSSIKGHIKFDRSSDHSPEVVFPVSVRLTKAGSPRVTVKLGKVLEGGFIYRFVNHATGEMYIGKSDKLNWRVYSHVSTANKVGKTSSEKTAQKLYAALKEHPENFTFEILKVEESPRQAEMAAIAHYQKKGVPLYNLNEGGGGPKGSKDDSKVSAEPMELSRPKIARSLAADFENLKN